MPRYFKTQAGIIRFDSETTNGVWVDGERRTILSWECALWATQDGCWTEITAEEAVQTAALKMVAERS